ncbi:DUF1127 domain-containing protein [Dinoroseobacter sp. S76]|uniref:DUF1127 domain-containing protein n=1 Tax=Dinoroseobacter sp. S76 TaxID=3415124 RepID=UPI003C7D9D4F
MAAFDTSRPYVVLPRFEAGLARFFGSIIAWNDARVTRNELSRLSERELLDVGLIPGDIDAVSRRRH